MLSWVRGEAGKGRGGKFFFKRAEGVKEESYAQSTPAENVFSKAEDRTTTRTVSSSEIRSKAAPYSRQNLLFVVQNIFTSRSFPVSRSIDRAHNVLFIKCIHGWSKRGTGGGINQYCCNYKEFEKREIDLLSSTWSTCLDGKLMARRLNWGAYDGAIGCMAAETGAVVRVPYCPVLPSSVENWSLPTVTDVTHVLETSPVSAELRTVRHDF